MALCVSVRVAPRSTSTQILFSPSLVLFFCLSSLCCWPPPMFVMAHFTLCVSIHLACNPFTVRRPTVNSRLVAVILCSLITPKARESLASHHLFPSFGLQNAFTSFLPHLAVLLHFLQSHITRWCMERDIPNAKRETNNHKREKSGNDSHWRWFLLLHTAQISLSHTP